jgi:hypothetical protein
MRTDQRIRAQKEFWTVAAVLSRGMGAVADGRRAANAVMDEAQHIAELLGYTPRSITNDDDDLASGWKRTQNRPNA